MAIRDVTFAARQPNKTHSHKSDRETSMRNAFNIVMRIFSTLLGLLVILMGSVWAMQGLHVGPAAIMRGMMVSDWHWALYGLIFALFGVGQVVWTNTRQAKA
jgi:hypothetical protein